MSKQENRTAPTFDFKKCCGQCKEAKDAAKNGTPVAPHKPCGDVKKPEPKPE